MVPMNQDVASISLWNEQFNCRKTQPSVTNRGQFRHCWPARVEVLGKLKAVISVTIFFITGTN
jgi:hypothetical protein